jgi:alginate biosynthesis protein AlgK
LLSLAIAIGLGGCAGLPDQRLANEALKRGDTAMAEQNYRQLADLGYSDAQVGLADIQVGTRDPELIKQAEATYRAAAATSPRAQSRLGKLLAVKPNSTEAEQLEEGLRQWRSRHADSPGDALSAIPAHVP